MESGQELSFLFHAPTRIVFGCGTAGDAGIELAALGGQRAFVLTDAGVRAAGLTGKVEQALGKLCVGVFDGVPQDTGVQVVEQAARMARDLEADSLVSVGGGSVIDTAKAVAVLLTEGGRLHDYQGFQMLTRRLAFHIAVPTTAGTGSEATFAALIKDHERKQKLLHFDRFLAPDTAILDPTLLVSLPARITAFTGMDAFTHAVESLHSLQSEPFADALALHAIRLVRENLPRCVQRGDDLAARGRMLAAATMAGQAFSNAMVGVVHALAHALGGRCGVPHGLANAILLPHGMVYNKEVCAERYALAAEALGVRERGQPDAEAAFAAIEAVRDLIRAVGLPTRLRDAGVPREALADCAEQALSDGAIVYNPRPADAPGLLAVLEQAW